MPDVAEVFSGCAAEYLSRYAQQILPSHRRALWDVTSCRTDRFGGHVSSCESCGYSHYWYHSCGNRSCPRCSWGKSVAWEEQQVHKLLDVPYYHLVFTVPRELHPIFRSQQKILYSLLMRAAADSLISLAADPRYVGGRIGMVVVLHTWTRAMVYHPHVHCLVPGGGLSDDNHWRPARNNFLVPVRALSKIFRAKFVTTLKKAVPSFSVPPVVWEKDWVVYSKAVVKVSSEKLIRYLARYIHRVAITNNRILRVEEDKVTFRYRDAKEGRFKIMTLDIMEFTRRFLQHVLPKGFHKVRSYGLMSPAFRRTFLSLRLLLPPRCMVKEKCEENMPLPQKETLCPQCQKDTLIIVSFSPPRLRSPPWKNSS